MRRADRLFRIVQALSSQRTVTARELAARLEVSARTIYRDMQDLSLAEVPLIAEPGNGYRLALGSRLPTLMFEPEELEAMHLGTRMVATWADPALADAAARAVEKIEAVLPERLRPQHDAHLLVPPGGLDAPVATTLGQLRAAITARRKVCFHYTRADGTASQRAVRPLGVAYWGQLWTLVAWCELRDDFRHFRLDRIAHLVESGEGFEAEAGRTLEAFLATVAPKPARGR